jgi:cyclopropane fatty-acyl-phospholipid synthase-like methyltransferase
MDRRTWLAERRAATEAVYDDEAPGYDEDLYPAEMQATFVARLLATCPPDGIVLDAPCGTGRYFPLVAASGRRIVGVDQSAGMLAQAEAKGIAVALHRVGLQELVFDGEFDATMTIDAMENVPPEDWPMVLANLRRAAKPGAHLYLTVEEVEDRIVDEAYAALRAQDLPAVRGEVVEGDVAGYHYYPGRERVRGWLHDAHVAIVAEDTEEIGDWAYWHLLLRRA